MHGVQELIAVDGEDEHNQGLHRNAMIVTLAQYCLAVGQRDPSVVPVEPLRRLASSVADDINLT